MRNAYIILMTGFVVFILLLVQHIAPPSQQRMWEHPIKGNPLPEEPLKKPVHMAINPTIELDFKSKEEIYKIRTRYVNQYRELAPKTYKPSDVIFGDIIGGKAWMGDDGISYYGLGPRVIEGPSEESRFLANPYLLVGLTSVLSKACKRFAPSKPIYPYALEMIWERRDLAHAYYDISSYWQIVKKCNNHPIWTRQLFPMAYNAKDFGYNYMGVDIVKSENIKYTEIAKSPAIIKHFIHLGLNLEYPGGCNNMSPDQPETYITIGDLPAKAHFKLWKEKPESINTPADFTFILYMI